MINKILSEKKFLVSIFFFISCLVLGFLFLYVERKIIGINPTFHPDSAWYLNNDALRSYSYLSTQLSFTENISNFFKNFYFGNLYYSIANIFVEIKKFEIINIQNEYRNLIILNIILYSLTNAIIIYYYLKFHHKEQKNFLFLFSLLIFFLLPYKLHLSVHILKESFIFFFLVIFILNQSKITFLISLFFGTSFRFGFALYYLIFFDFRSFFKLNKILFFSLILFLLFCIFYFNFMKTNNIFESLLIFIEERNMNVMTGRSFDKIPNFSESEIGYVYRSIIWPILFLSGGFIFFTENVFFKILGIEIILMQIFTYICHRKIILNFGLIILLIIISLWVTTFTSFYRYAYLGFLALFLKKIFNTKIRNKM
jgi:hypothetical protein